MRMRILFFVLATLLDGSPTQAQDFDEYAVKAAFLLNFAAFTDWPATIATDFNVCVIGKDPFGASLDKMIGRNIEGHTVSVKRLQGLDGRSNCQIVFIARDRAGNAIKLVEEVKAGVLTVADADGLARQGVMINMSLSADKVSFEVNNAAAKRAGLRISSKLLRLATAVY